MLIPEVGFNRNIRSAFREVIIYDFNDARFYHLILRQIKLRVVIFRQSGIFCIRFGACIFCNILSIKLSTYGYAGKCQQ